MNPPAGKFEQRLFAAYLLLLIWLPLPLGSNRPWAAAIFVGWAGLLCLAYLAGLRRGAVQSGVTFNQARVAWWLLAGWLAWLTLQWLPMPPGLRQWLSPQGFAIQGLAGNAGWTPLSLDPFATFRYWLNNLGYAALFALTLLLVNSKLRLVMLAYALVFSGLLQAFYGGIMTLSGMEYGFFVPKEFYRGTATGTFVNRNHLAGYLEMTLAVGIGLLLATQYRKEQALGWRQHLRNLLNLVFSQKLPLRLALAIMVIALVLTRSRMGNTAFFASMLIAGLIVLVAYRHQTGSFATMFRRDDTRSAVILIASLVVIDLFIVGAWFGVEQVAQRIADSSLSHDADRIDVSRDTLALIADYPLTGTGGGSFHLAFMPYRSQAIAAYYDHAHQDYLEIMADTGLIGASLFGLFVLASLLAALKALHRRRDDLMRGMAFASIMAIVALAIHGTVDFNLQIPANAATFMVILALGWIALHLDRQEERAHGR